MMVYEKYQVSASKEQNGVSSLVKIVLGPH